MNFDIARAWKDEAYRQTLSEEELQMIPANPAGTMELSENDMEAINGGGGFAGPVCEPLAPGCPGPIAANKNNSLALVCQLDVYSVNAVNVALLLAAVTQPCISSN